jgi:hypothetical protein
MVFRLLLLRQAGVEEVRCVHWLWCVFVGEDAFAAVGHTAFRADTDWFLATATGTDFRLQADAALLRY